MIDYSRLMRSDILECATPFIITVFLEIVFIAACIFLFKRISKLGKAICVVLMLFPAIILTVNIVNNLPELTRMIGDYAHNDYQEYQGTVVAVHDIKNSEYDTVTIDERSFCCDSDLSIRFGQTINSKCRIVYGDTSEFIILFEVSKGE